MVKIIKLLYVEGVLELRSIPPIAQECYYTRLSLGWKAEEHIGKSDFDSPTIPNECAAEFVKIDKKAFSVKKNILEMQLIIMISGNYYFLKKPLCKMPSSPFSLTDKQENCLFWLIRGKSVKEIARILKLSPRTIKGHVETLKIKLNYQYKSEIIEIAIHHGFLCYIPKDFQNMSLDQIFKN